MVWAKDYVESAGHCALLIIAPVQKLDADPVGGKSAFSQGEQTMPRKTWPNSTECYNAN